MTALPGVNRLVPLTLDELVAESDLQARVDRKYLVPTADVPVLVDLMSPATRVLQIDGRRSFAYRSVYLDTPDLRCFHSAGRGRRLRFKVRGRGYLDSGVTWLEVKTRAARGMTLKSRVLHPDVEHGPLGPDGRGFVRSALHRQGLTAADVAALAPVLITTYCRTTLHLPGVGGRPSSRGTIDSSLTFSAPGPERRSLTLGGLTVVESKGGAAPSALDRQLWRMGHRPVALSKYGTGLAAVHRDLPELKWHRTLRRHLRPSLDLSFDTSPDRYLDHKDPS